VRRFFVALLLLVAAAVPVAAQSVFVSTVVIGMSTRPGGDYSFSPVAVPTGVHGLSFTMDISEASGTLPDIAAALEGSLDGGVNWGPAGAFTRTAGPKVNDKSGNLQTTTGATFTGGDFWNDTQNVNRRLRGSATIGGTLRFALTVQPLSD
jgi:hypothetical protein